MSENEDKNFLNNIKHVFDNMTYSEQYDTDIWITVVIVLIFIFIVLYLTILNSLKSFRSNWDNIKCNPFIIPFAGIINPGLIENDENFVENNFKSCLNDLNKEISDKSRNSINDIFNLFNEGFADASSIGNSILEYISHLVEMIIAMFTEFTNRIFNIFTALSVTFAGVTNFLSHILGIFSVLYNEIVIVVDSSKLIITLMALAFLASVVIPSILATTILFLLALAFKVLFMTCCSPLCLWLGCIFKLPGIVTLIAAFLLLAWTIFVIILYVIIANSAASILTKTLAPVSSTGAIYMDPVPKAPSPMI